MDLDIAVSLKYALGSEQIALLALEAAQYEGQTVQEQHLDIADATLRGTHGECGIGRRKWVRVHGKALHLRYSAKVHVSRKPARLEDLPAGPFERLPGETITFLRPSRFCQSDQLETFAAKEFGHVSGGAKIKAIADWIASGLEYVPGHSDAGTTALDTLETRKGVCRDYAHIMCGLARGARIPARYVSAYGLSVDPPDFHAVVEVWLGGAWYLVDPTGMCATDEIVVIGVGRDAGDVPFMETPDEAQFRQQAVRVTRT